MGGNDVCVLGLVAIVVILARCFVVPLLIFSINRGTLRSDEQRRIDRDFYLAQRA